MYETIARLCAKRNINVATMCKEIGLQPTSISALKHGRAKALSIGNAARIADYFGVTVDELLNGEAPERTEKLPRYREFREKAGRTLGSAQIWTGIPCDTIERIETGDDVPTLYAIDRLAKAYGCSVEDLTAKGEGNLLQYEERTYNTERERNVDALAREILRISHEQGLSLNDIKTACDKCERFVLQSTVPLDDKGWMRR